MSQILSFLQEVQPGGLKQMGVEQVWELLQAAIGLALHCQKDDWMDYMFRCVPVGNKIPVGFVTCASYIQSILETNGTT